MTLSRRIGAIITESITIAPGPIICALLCVPLTSTDKSIAYLLPVVLAYATMKTGVLLVSESFKIEDPYKLIYTCISISFVGSIILMFATDSTSSLYLLGSILLGLGLSPFSSLYNQFLMPPAYKRPRSKADSYISLLIGLFIAFLCLLCKKHNSRVIFYVWVIYILIIWLYIYSVCSKLIDKTKAVVSLKEGFAVRAIPTAILFVLIAASNSYKRSGTPKQFFILLILFFVYIIWIMRYDRRLSRRYHFQTFWLGSVFGFILFYCSVYCSSTGNGDKIFILYIVAMTAKLFAPIVGRSLEGLYRNNIILLCMVSCIVGLVLIITQNLYLVYLGVFICSLFVSVALPVNMTWYIQNDLDTSREYKLHQDGIYSIGAGMVQSFTMIVFSLVSLLFMGNYQTIMSNYLNPNDITDTSFILNLSGFICLIFFVVSLIYIFKRKKY